MESITRPFSSRWSSVSYTSPFHARSVTSNTGFKRLEVVSSGPKERKLRSFSFSL